jgi:drug/metabolite transporter (DMT)-like permease
MKQTSLGGIGVMVIATFVFALQDAITKTLITELPVSQILFVRFAAFAIMALILAHRASGLKNAFVSKAPGTQVLRCLLMCAEIAIFAYALRFLGIAQIHALFAVFPLFVAALSVPLLREAVGWRRWVAMLIGFAGTLVILQPGTEVFDIYALLPLGGAVLYALYNLLTRRVSKHDSYMTSLVYFGVVGTIASGSVAITQWQPMNQTVTLQLLYLCIASIIAHMMLMKALELTEAVVLQPFQYLILPWAMVLGYLLFDETLDAITLLGASIVVGSGVYVAYREYKMQKMSASEVTS